MDPEAPRYSAIVGCGPTGCIIVSLLRQSAARSKLIAVGEDEELLASSGADQKVLVRPGETVSAEVGTMELVFVVIDPTEGSSMAHARDVALRASTSGAYVFGLVIRPPGAGDLDLPEVRRAFGGAAIVDAAWVLEKRGGADAGRALQIAFNFAAHALTFLAGAMDAGDLSVPVLKAATSGRVAGFAASHLSEPGAVYAMTMSPISSALVRSGIVFLDEGIGDVQARRVFLGVARVLPRDASLVMIRARGLEPFKVLAMLAQ